MGQVGIERHREDVVRRPPRGAGLVPFEQRELVHPYETKVLAVELADGVSDLRPQKPKDTLHEPARARRDEEKVAVLAPDRLEEPRDKVPSEMLRDPAVQRGPLDARPRQPGRARLLRRGLEAIDFAAGRSRWPRQPKDPGPGLLRAAHPAAENL